MPQRIHRRRVKGYRMPPNCVSVCRPGRWGNPFGVDHWEKPVAGSPYWSVVVLATHKVLRRVHSKMEAVVCAIRAFRLYARLRLRREPDWLEPLRGKDLACFCNRGAFCHADVLLELANA